MGHERLGGLPKTQKWREIVATLPSVSSTDQARAVASNTIESLRGRFDKLRNEPALQVAFQFLVRVSLAGRQRDFEHIVGKPSPNLSTPTPLRLAMRLRDDLRNVALSAEYGTIIQQAAADALARWYQENDTGQGSLFEGSSPEDVWQKSGTGSGFCELSRHFFAAISERYLLYFIEREAGRVADSADSRIAIRTNLHEHVAIVSKHAFETAKITQSYAAGWFNKNTVSGDPSIEAVDQFLDYAITKMRGELHRENQQ